MPISQKMCEKIIQLKWQRPDSVEYPKVWHRFNARDLNSDKMVEYRIEDLLESRAEEAYNHMKENYLADEPVSHALGGYSDEDHFEDYCYGWKSIFAQKMPLVCYKEGSDEIVGLNWIFITHKDDQFFEQYFENCKSPITKAQCGISDILYEKFNPFDFYDVEEYMASLALSVDKKYRGRAIGDHFLASRKIVCQQFGVKLTHTMFSSDYSNQNADKTGFKTDVTISFEEVNKIHPEYNLANIKSKEMAIKTLIIERQ